MFFVSLSLDGVLLRQWAVFHTFHHVSFDRHHATTVLDLYTNAIVIFFDLVQVMQILFLKRVQRTSFTSDPSLGATLMCCNMMALYCGSTAVPCFTEGGV